MVANVGTFIITSTNLVISSGMGIRQISMSLISGTVTYAGSLKAGGVSSQALTLVDGEFPNISSDYPIDGFTIDASAGSVKVLLNQ